MTDEEIMAYVDDELGEDARARMTQAARGDAALAARIAAERALRDRLRGHFAPMAEVPVPEAWVATIRNAAAPVGTPTVATVTSLDAARAARDKRLRAASGGNWRNWSARKWVGGAIAAALVLGVALGDRMYRAVAPVSGKDSSIASGELAQALDTQLASAQDGAPIRILGTFLRQGGGNHSGGGVCRVFVGMAASGIACHDSAGWQLQHAEPGAKPAQGAYRQAGSDQAALMAQAQAMMAGDPLDAAQERAMRDHRWQ